MMTRASIAASAKGRLKPIVNWKNKAVRRFRNSLDFSQRRFARVIAQARRNCPTGWPIDDILIYLDAWNRLGYAPHIVDPRSFNEHFVLNKIHFRGDLNLAKTVTDKFLFKEWLKESGHAELVVPTLGVYETVDEVRDRLFEKNTILKPTHLSGSAILFWEPRSLVESEISELQRWLDTDYYKRKREKTYKGLERRLMCEELLIDATDSVAKDYKFYMCAGEVLMIQVDHDRFTGHSQQLYSRDWKLHDFQLEHTRNPLPIEPPANLQAAIDIAAELSRPFSLCRVDLYLPDDGTIKAGELTFFPHGGMGKFTPLSADFEMGEKVRELLRS